MIRHILTHALRLLDRRRTVLDLEADVADLRARVVALEAELARRSVGTVH